MPPPPVIVQFSPQDTGVQPTLEELQQGVRELGQAARESTELATTGLGGALVAFRSIGHGVQQVQADFAAGTLTTQGYQEALARARVEAISLRQSVGDLSSKELSAFSSIVRNTTQQTAGATFQFDRMRSKLVSLAASAAGVPGPLGQIAGQAASFAVGGPLVAGAALGFALLAKHLHQVGEEGRAAKKEFDEAIARLLKLRESRRAPEQQQAEDVARVRDQLAVVTEKLGRAEAFLAEQRARLAAGDTGIRTVEAAVNALIAEKGKLLQAINAPVQAKAAQERTEQEKAYADALKDVTQRLAVLRIELAHVGGSHDALTDALLREELARQKLTAAEIDALVLKDREARLLTQELADRRAILQLLRETRATVVAIPDPGLRGLRPPTEKPPGPGGSGTVDVVPLSAAETFASQLVDSFGLSINMVHELGASLDNLADGSLGGLEQAFEHVFDAIVSGGKVSGDQLAAGMLAAISKAARAESAFYFARGVAALAASIFPFPRPDNAISAGQYFTAAALMGGVGLLTGIGARAIGGGGGSAGARDAALGGSSDRVASESRLEAAPRRLVLKGDVWDYTDPRFVDNIVAALQEAGGRGVGGFIVTREP